MSYFHESLTTTERERDVWVPKKGSFLSAGLEQPTGGVLSVKHMMGFKCGSWGPQSVKDSDSRSLSKVQYHGCQSQKCRETLYFLSGLLKQERLLMSRVRPKEVDKAPCLTRSTSSLAELVAQESQSDS